MAESTEIIDRTPQTAFSETLRAEHEQVRLQLKEIRLLVEQSQGEVDKLAQRNATVAARLHQLHANFDTVPREDIRATYEVAQDTQQRLFTMRGQLEKLQSDQAHLERLSDLMIRTLKLLEKVSEVEAPPQVGADDSFLQRLIEAQENERHSISRQIHDGPAQSLSNFILQAEIAMRLLDRDVEAAREELTSLKAAAGTTFAQMRGFIFELRPMMLDDLGLIPTVRRYVDAVKDETGLDLSLVITGTERRIEPHLEVLLFRAIQTILKDVRDHTHATRAKLTVDIGDQLVRVLIEDNDKGLDLSAADGASIPLSDLSSVDKRLVQAGGTFDIEELAGDGRRISITLPFRGAASKRP